MGSIGCAKLDGRVPVVARKVANRRIEWLDVGECGDDQFLVLPARAAQDLENVVIQTARGWGATGC